MADQEIVNEIFDDLIADAKDDSGTTTELKYLEAKRQKWLVLVRYAPQYGIHSAEEVE